MITLAQYHHLSALSLRDQPSEAQALLLRAALFQGEPALAAWHSWRITADLDRLPLGGFGLLPLLADNLQRLGVQDPILDKCHGIHRHTWTQNQLYCRQLAGVFQDLQENNCSPLLWGDLLLVLRDYPGQGLRLIHQVDLFTPMSQVAIVQKELRAAGWQLQRSIWRRLLPLGDDQPQRFKQSENRLSLNWYSSPSDKSCLLTSNLWHNHRWLVVNGVSIPCPNSTDFLLWICTRGIVDFWRFGAIQWVADAVMVLRRAGSQIDWPHLLQSVAKHGLTFRMAVALGALVDWVNAPIPPAILETIAAMPVPRFERWGAICSSKLPQSITFLLRIP